MLLAEERAKILRGAEPDSWVAFSADEERVVGYAKTFSEVVRLAKEAGEQDPVISRIPPNWEPMVL